MAGERSEQSGREPEPEAAIVEMLERELRLMESDYRRTLEAEPAARAGQNVRAVKTRQRRVILRACVGEGEGRHHDGRLTRPDPHVYVCLCRAPRSRRWLARTGPRTGTATAKTASLCRQDTAC
jgi:hypothetical protein